MTKLYDAIMVKGTLRPRLNKVLVSPEKVPEDVMNILTLDNIVNEHGIIIVDNKGTAEPGDAKADPNDDGGKLARIDQAAPDKGPEPTEPSDQHNVDEEEPVIQEPTEPAIEGSEDVDTGAMQIDDSANDEEGDEPNDTGTSEQNPKNPEAPVAEAAPDKGPEPTTSEPEKKTPARRKRTAPAPQPRFRSLVPQSSQGMGFPRKNGKTVDIFDLVTPHTHVRLVGNVTVPLSTESYQTRTELEITNRLQELGIETVDFNQIEAGANGGESAPAGLLMDDAEEEEDIQLG